MSSRIVLAALGAIFSQSLLPPAAAAQSIIGIGDVPRVNGLRVNFRDRRLEEVNGVNITIWSPYRPARGEVNGLAIGLPMTGAADIDGVVLGAFGANIEQRFRGIGIGGLGVGAGEEAVGILLGGLGVGTGGTVTGVAIGGLGVGSGGNVRGIMIGGLGVGGGGDISGISIGGLGVGSGGRVSGLSIGGLGVGSGGGISGVTIAGVGAGGGGDVTGVTIAGVGVGSGGTVKWVAIAGAAVGGMRVEGLAIAGGAVGAKDLRALAIAPGLIRVVKEGTQHGVGISAVTWIQGTQRGLTLGVVNYAWQLDGLQIGAINIVRDNPPSRRVLPILNW